MEYVVEKTIEEEREEGTDEGFPSFLEIVDFLMESNFVSEKEIKEVRRTVKKKIEAELETPKLTATFSSPPTTLKGS